MKFIAIIVIFALGLMGCRKRESVVIQKTEITIAALGEAKVVAYRFVQPADREPISLIGEKGKLDLETLQKLKCAEATLTAEQVKRLVQGVYGSHEQRGPAACYDPHHIFLFYDSNNVLFHVIEVCFECINVHSEPPIEQSQWARHDFLDLARLCDEVGLGRAEGTAEELIQQ